MVFLFGTTQCSFFPLQQEHCLMHRLPQEKEEKEAQFTPRVLSYCGQHPGLGRKVNFKHITNGLGPLELKLGITMLERIWE